MPSITVIKADLEQLLGARVDDLEALDRELEVAKAEVKGYDASTDELKIELNDTNRPDLWSPPGIARQLRTHRAGSGEAYPFATSFGAAASGAAAAEAEPGYEIRVDPALESIRPYVAGFVAKGQPLDETALKSLIQSQEKLAENFGRRRAAVAIGAYRISEVELPIHYKAADPQATRFAPLDFDVELDLRTILTEHPKGREYGHLISHFERFPLLTDATGGVLSMPPVINSNTLGHVVEGDTDLFIEVTGHDLRQLMLAINIAAVDLADRGATIHPVTVHYPYDTPYGREVTTPYDFHVESEVEITAIHRMLGEELADEEITRLLRAMGHREVEIVNGSEERCVRLRAPIYRDDLLHPVDMIEDVAIAKNLNSFEPILPKDFTIGKLSDAEESARSVGEQLIGCGFQEVVSTMLTSREALYERMRLPEDDRCVEVDNVMSGNFAVLRDTAIPSLLSVEAVSAKAIYPHRTFEIGEIVERAADEVMGCRTRVVAAALLTHPKATISELQSYLEALCFYMVKEYTLVPTEHPSFMDGRVGDIVIDGHAAGRIGELHPECLERWGLSVPVSVFEVAVDALS